MKKGTEPAYPSETSQLEKDEFDESVRIYKQNAGISIRLKIASDAMCAILSNADTLRDLTRSYGNKKPSERPEFEELVANCALCFTEALIKREEETR